MHCHFTKAIPLLLLAFCHRPSPTIQEHVYESRLMPKLSPVVGFRVGPSCLILDDSKATARLILFEWPTNAGGYFKKEIAFRIDKSGPEELTLTNQDTGLKLAWQRSPHNDYLTLTPTLPYHVDTDTEPWAGEFARASTADECLTSVKLLAKIGVPHDPPIPTTIEGPPSTQTGGPTSHN